jgi:hypothetical protein
MKTTRHLSTKILAIIMVATKSRLWVYNPTNLSFNSFKARNTQKTVLEHMACQFKSRLIL